MANDCPSGCYLAELVTASGLTVQHPLEDPGSTLGVPHSLIDWSGSEVDFAEWDALAVGLLGRLEKSWLLFKSWPAVQRMAAADYNIFAVPLDSVRKRYSELRKPWRGYGSSADPYYAWGYGGPDAAIDATDDIAKLTQILVDAQCLRQRLDEKLADLGGKPDGCAPAHAPQAPGMSILGTIGLVAAGLTIVVGVPLVLRKVLVKP